MVIKGMTADEVEGAIESGGYVVGLASPRRGRMAARITLHTAYCGSVGRRRRASFPGTEILMGKSGNGVTAEEIWERAVAMEAGITAHNCIPHPLPRVIDGEAIRDI